MMKTGLPKLTRKISTTVKKIAMNRLVIMAGGVSVLAAISARNIVDDIAMSLSVGVSGALLLMTQVFYSEEDESSVRETVKSSVVTLIVGVGIISVLLFFLSPLFIPLFGLDARNAQDAVTAIRYFSVSLILISLNEMLFDYLQGVRKYKWANVFIVFQRLTILPIAYLLIHLWGLRGLFLAYIVGKIPVTVGYGAAAFLLNRKSCDGVLRSLLCIPKRFSESRKRSLDLELSKPEEIINISVLIEKFCLEQGIDRRRAVHASLCTEEMVSNVILHGFTKDEASHTCSVRVLVSNEKLVLRFRDNCKYFNLKERYELLKNSDAATGIGIKIVYGIAEEIRYSHVLNLNTLQITL